MKRIRKNNGDIHLVLVAERNINLGTELRLLFFSKLFVIAVASLNKLGKTQFIRSSLKNQGILAIYSVINIIYFLQPFEPFLFTLYRYDYQDEGNMVWREKVLIVYQPTE